MCRNTLIENKLMRIYGLSLVIAIIVFFTVVFANENENTSHGNQKMTDNPEAYNKR